MGCDIHDCTEVYENGHWEKADISSYSGRNYNLFAILANVRNGVGFANVKTGGGFNPIASPKGIPSDCCDEFRAWADDYGIDGHSHSYLTVQELLDYDWTQVTQQSGTVSEETYKTYLKTGEEPDMWFYPFDSSGTVDEEDYLQDPEHYAGKQINMNWEVNYKDSAGPGWDKLFTAMQELAKEHGPENVRMVFFFDN